jgi:hypothetical protein
MADMIDRIGSEWRRVKRLYVFLLPARFSFLALAVLVFAFCLSDQGADILRALTEDGTGWPKLRVVALLSAEMMLALVIWYWTRHLLRLRPRAKPAADPTRDRDREPLVEDHRALTRWTPRVLGLLVFVIAMAGFSLTAWQYRADAPTKTWIMLGLLAAESVGFWLLVVNRRRLFDVVQEDMTTTIRSLRELGRSTRVALLLTIVAEIMLFTWALLAPVSWWVLGVAAVLVLTIGVWVPIGGLLAALGAQLRLPILGVVIAWAFAISHWTDNHVIRSVSPLPDRLTLSEAFDQWYGRVRSLPGYVGSERPIPVIVVAAEGGGIRAAYWTATVLTALQDKFPTFADHVFAISGVSGGALGAVLFDALLARRLTGDRQESGGGLALARRLGGSAPLKPDVRTVLGFDSLSGTLASMSQPDFVARFVPLLPVADRAFALESGWEHGWCQLYQHGPCDPLMGRGFVATLAKHPELPQLFLNGTIVEDGARIIASRVRLRGGRVPSGTERTIEFRSAHDFFDVFQADVPMSTAAGLSARFTYVSPAGIVPSDGETLGRSTFGHIIDGGYFENSGAVTAGEIVDFLARRPAVRPLAIIIDYAKVEGRCQNDAAPFCPAPGRCGPGAPASAAGFANETLSPLLGLLNTRVARGRQAVADLTQRLSNDDGSQDVVGFRLIPRNTPLPLGWVLSDRAMNVIDAAVDCEGGNRSAVASVGEWLGVEVPPAECLLPIEDDGCTPSAEVVSTQCIDEGCREGETGESRKAAQIVY